MPDMIEIQSDGTMIADHFTVGKVTFSSPFPADFLGLWFDDDPKRAAEDAEAAATDEINDLTKQVDELEGQLKDATQDAEDAESALSSLADEVRAFLAGGDTGNEALTRLAEALEGAGG